MNKLLPLLLIFMVACSSTPVPSTIVITNTFTSIPTVTNTPLPTHTPLPTDTPEPTNTPLPTKTPKPTSTSQPTSTIKPIPEPIILSGKGDSIVDLHNEILGRPIFAHIQGNNQSHHFAVQSYDADGNLEHLLVNTTEIYDGYLFINILDKENANRLQVTATGEWTITLYPPEIVYLHTLMVPGKYKGKGDDAIVLGGKDRDTIRITGNKIGHHFAVIAYSETGMDLLVNTVEEYDGLLIMNRSTLILVITCDDEWSIEITGK